MSSATFRLTLRSDRHDEPQVSTGLSVDQALGEIHAIGRMIRQGAVHVSSWSLVLEPHVEYAGHTSWRCITERPKHSPDMVGARYVIDSHGREHEADDDGAIIISDEG